MNRRYFLGKQITIALFYVKINSVKYCVIKTKNSDRHPSAYRSFTVISVKTICKADYFNSLQTVSGA